MTIKILTLLRHEWMSNHLKSMSNASRHLLAENAIDIIIMIIVLRNIFFIPLRLFFCFNFFKFLANFEKLFLLSWLSLEFKRFLRVTFLSMWNSHCEWNKKELESLLFWNLHKCDNNFSLYFFGVKNSSKILNFQSQQKNMIEVKIFLL